MANFMDFLQPLGVPEGETQPWQPPQFSALMQPQPEEVQAMFKPPADENEVGQRLEGWKRVLAKMNDPNVQRAIGLVGAYLLQPKAPGETDLSRIGKGLMFGMSAYDMGRLADEEAAARKAKMREQEAATAFKEGQVEKQRFEIDLARDTREDVIRKLQSEAEKAELELQKAQSQEEVDKIVRQYQARKNSVLAGLPDKVLQSAIVSELEAKGVENDLRRAQAAANRALAASRNEPKGPDVKLMQFEEAEKLKNQIAAEYENILNERAQKLVAEKKGKVSLSEARALVESNPLFDPKTIATQAEMRVRAKMATPQANPQTAPQQQKKVITLEEAEKIVNASKPQDNKAKRDMLILQLKELANTYQNVNDANSKALIKAQIDRLSAELQNVQKAMGM